MALDRSRSGVPVPDGRSARRSRSARHAAVGQRKGTLTTLVAVAGGAAVFLLLMMGAFWALFVLPWVVFVVVTLAFALISTMRPEGQRKRHLLLIESASVNADPGRAAGERGGEPGGVAP